MGSGFTEPYGYPDFYQFWLLDMHTRVFTKRMNEKVLTSFLANDLNVLTKHPYRQDALHNLFKWLVMNTKEQNGFHVILSSSNSFFNLWVSNLVGAVRYKTYIIGDLPEVDASRFWEQWQEGNWEKLTTVYKYSPTSSGLLRVLITTIAFSMGIDCQDIRCVIHFRPTCSAPNLALVD